MTAKERQQIDEHVAMLLAVAKPVAAEKLDRIAALLEAGARDGL